MLMSSSHAVNGITMFATCVPNQFGLVHGANYCEGLTHSKASGIWSRHCDTCRIICTENIWQKARTGSAISWPRGWTHGQQGMSWKQQMQGHDAGCFFLQEARTMPGEGLNLDQLSPERSGCEQQRVCQGQHWQEHGAWWMNCRVQGWMPARG